MNKRACMSVLVTKSLSALHGADRKRKKNKRKAMRRKTHTERDTDKHRVFVLFFVFLYLPAGKAERRSEQERAISTPSITPSHAWWAVLFFWFWNRQSPSALLHWHRKRKRRILTRALSLPFFSNARRRRRVFAPAFC